MNVYLLFFLVLLLIIAAIYTGLKFQWDETDAGKAYYLGKTPEFVSFWEKPIILEKLLNL